MSSYHLIRTESTNQGTIGELTIKDKLFYTMELPWKDNKKDISCIIAGTYDVVPIKHNRFGDCWLLKDVPDRTDILIHAGNFGGDTEHGWKSDVKGCIAPGLTRGFNVQQPMVGSSKEALKQINELLERKPFKIIVDWFYKPSVSV